MAKPTIQPKPKKSSAQPAKTTIQPKKAKSSMSPRTREIWIVVFFLLLSLIFFRGLLSPKNALWGTDTINEYYPRYHFAKETMEKYGEIAHWYPNAMGGLPFYAVGFPYYHPLRAALMPFDKDGLGIYTKIPWIVHLFLGGYLMYLLLLTFGVRRLAAIFGGIAYMFTASILTIIYAGHEGKLYSYWLIPGIFAAFHLGVVRRNINWFLVAGIGMALQLLSPHTQATFHTGLILGFYTLYHIGIAIKEKEYKWLWRLGVFALVAVIVALLLGGVQTIPQLEYGKYTARATMEDPYKYATSYSFPPEETLRFLAPNVFGWLSGQDYWGGMELKLNTEYMGVWVFLLALIGAFGAWRKREVKFLAILALFGILVAYGRNFPLYKLLYYTIPKFNMMRAPGQFLILFAFPMCVLAGIGLHELAERWKKQASFNDLVLRIAMIFTLVFVLLAGVASIGGFNNALTSYLNGKQVSLDVARENLSNGLWRVVLFGLIGTALIFVLAYKKLGWTLVAIIFTAVTLVDLFMVDTRYLAIDNKNIIKRQFMEPDAAVKVMQQEKDPWRILPVDEFTTSRYSYHNIQSAGGFSAVKADLYDKYMDKIGINTISLLSMWGIKYIKTSNDLSQMGMEKVADNVYKNNYALPRAYIVDSVVIAKEDSFAVSYMTSTEFNASRIAVVEEEIAGAIGPATGSYATILDYQPNYIKLEANATGQCLLVLSDLYYPLWKVTVDGSPKKIIRTNFLFRGVYLDHAGKQIVEFRMDPKWQQRAKSAGMWAFIILAAYFVWALFKKVRQDENDRAMNP